MSSSITHYAHSLILSGLDELKLPLPAQATVTVHGSSTSRIYLVYERCNDAENELLSKMFAAITIPLADVFHVSFSYEDNEPAGQVEQSLFESLGESTNHVIIALGPKALRECMPFTGNYDTIRTIAYRFKGNSLIALDHPRDMIATPQLKRRSWESLQQVQKSVAST